MAKVKEITGCTVTTHMGDARRVALMRFLAEYVLKMEGCTAEFTVFRTQTGRDEKGCPAKC